MTFQSVFPTTRNIYKGNVLHAQDGVMTFLALPKNRDIGLYTLQIAIGNFLITSSSLQTDVPSLIGILDFLKLYLHKFKEVIPDSVSVETQNF